MKIGQTSIIFFLSKIGVSVIGFFATIFFTRTLGEEIYGFYAISIALVSWLGMIKSIGFGSAIMKRMSESEEPDAYLVAGTIIKTILILPVGIGVMVFTPQVNEYVGQPVAEFIILLLIALILSEVVSNALKGSHRVHIYAPLSTLGAAAQNILMVVFVFIGWELTGMLVGHAAGTLLMSFIGFWIIKPTLVLPEKRHFVRLYDYAKFAWLGNMRGKTISDADIIILGIFVPTGLTGVYAVTYSLSKFLDLFGRSISGTLFPEMSKLSTDGDLKMVGSLTSDALAFGGLFLIPGIIGSAILGDRLLSIYGPGFVVGDQVLVILLLGLLVYTYAKQLLNALNAIDRPDLTFRANGVFIVTNIVLNFILIWQIGWVGAAIAIVLSAMAGLILAFYYLRPLVAFSIPFDEISRQWIAALLMGLLVYATREFSETRWTWIDDYNAVFVVLLVGIGAAIYFLTLLAISTQFRQTVDRNLPVDIPFLST